jgi:hypothetical protein
MRRKHQVPGVPTAVRKYFRRMARKSNRVLTPAQKKARSLNATKAAAARKAKCTRIRAENAQAKTI